MMMIMMMFVAVYKITWSTRSNELYLHKVQVVKSSHYLMLIQLAAGGVLPSFSGPDSVNGFWGLKA